MIYRHTINNKVYRLKDLKSLLANSSPFRSGDNLAGICSETYEERIAAQITLADVPLKVFLNETVIPYEDDEITRLIIDNHDNIAFSLIDSLTVGELRDWLLNDETTGDVLKNVSAGITP